MSIHNFRLIVLGSALIASTAHGQIVRDWQATPSKGNGAPTAAVTYYDANLVSSTYVSVNKTLYGYRAANGAVFGAGFVTAGALMPNFASVVPLADGKRYIFAGSQDGYLYKINADTMATTATKKIRRGGCASDWVQATPSVQLAAYSHNFTPNKDLVFVATYHGCGDTTGNQILALDAATLAVEWTFNVGDYQMDFVSAGCSVDYDNNRIYCGSNQPVASFQNTVWAISTNDGSLVWAGNFNGVRTRPQISRGTYSHLYVADMLGTLHAIDLATGAEHWTVAVTSGEAPGAYIGQNMWAEFRAPYADTIFVTDSTGVLHAINDGGTATGRGVELWKTSFAGGQKVQSLGSVSPTLGKVYVGLSDMTIHQLDLSTGSDEANRTVASGVVAGGDIVTDPTLHTNGGSEVAKLVVSANTAAGGTVTKQFPVPWNTTTTGASLLFCTSNADCAPLNAPSNCLVGSTTNDCCAVGTCNLGTGTCYTAPQNIAAHSCNDGLVSPLNGNKCTTARHCVVGACVGDWNYAASGCPAGTTNCSLDKLRGCGAGKTCAASGLVAGGSFACVDTQTDLDACGSAGRACNATSSRSGGTGWGGNRVCNKGVCERDTGFCSEPPVATLQSTVQTSNTTGITFNRRLNASAYQCTAWTSQDSTTVSVNKMAKISPGGQVTNYPAQTPPGHMSGITIVGSTADEAYVSFNSDASSANRASGRFDNKNLVVTNDIAQGNMPFNEQPKSTPCASPPCNCKAPACPFVLAEYNNGPTPPATDGTPVMAGGHLAYGNWQKDGDVWVVYYNTDSKNPPLGWRAKPAWTAQIPPTIDPPWCPSGGCTSKDRVVAVDYINGALTDGFLRIALDTSVWLLGTAGGPTQIDLTKGYWHGGKYFYDALNIEQVVSLNCDPLNGNNTCIAEVRDGPTKETYFVHIGGDVRVGGDPPSVRLLADLMADHWNSVWPPSTSSPVLPPKRLNSGDGRVTVSSQQHMYRIAPIKPSNNSGTVPFLYSSMPR